MSLTLKKRRLVSRPPNEAARQTTRKRSGRQRTAFLWVLTVWITSASRADFAGQDLVEFPKDMPLRITTIEIEPYVMSHRTKGNSTTTPDTGGSGGSGGAGGGGGLGSTPSYSGYIPDLLKELATILNFRYVVHLANGYGHRQVASRWDGMIGELQNQNADVAAGPLYVTDHRKEVVDFTVPFLNVHATLLLRKTPSGAAIRIRSLTDLINQSEIRYGTLDRGIILRAFKRTNDTVPRIIWRTIQRLRDQGVMTSSNEEGIERVRREKYGFILPDTIGEYIALQPPCDLVTVGRFLMKRGYGLALQKQSPYLGAFNRALKAMRKSGKLDELRARWWTESEECRGTQSSQRYGGGGAGWGVSRAVGEMFRRDSLWSGLVGGFVAAVMCCDFLSFV